MNNFSLFRYALVLSLPGLSLLFCSCKKEKYPFDIFPLKIGNEFYYNYHYKRYPAPINYDISGTETWKVLSSTALGDSVRYTIERKLNAIWPRWVNGPNGHWDTVRISDSIRYLEIYENKSGYFSLKLLDNVGVYLKKNQTESEILVSKEGATIAPSWSYAFAADSGLTMYQYYRPPNTIIIHSLKLDSLKIII